jgi:RimJ/RimL family protein N-acetyltransferase
VSISIRRAREDDVSFLAALASHVDVEPFLGAVAARDERDIEAEVMRSLREPHDFGRFVIEVDRERAGAMGFELANRRSRIAHLERLAVHPDFRGRAVADHSARLLQRHLVVDLGYHRLELEVYGFNERALRHAERAGFAREGVRRRAYWRHGGWVDGVLYGLVADELALPAASALLHEYLGVHNECVRSGDWSPLPEWFAEDAVLEFVGIPVGPFAGREAIARAYAERPPDDQVLTFEVDGGDDEAIARYGWLREPAHVAGTISLVRAGGTIRRLRVSFEERMPAA